MAGGFVDYLRMVLGWKSSPTIPDAIVSERFDLIGSSIDNKTLYGSSTEKFTLYGTSDKKFPIRGS